MPLVPQHIKVQKGDIAERVLISGDPARTVQLSKYLRNAKLVNENRGYITYTGEYDDKPVTICCHGVGAPSAAIVIEELIMFGAKSILRLGTCGGFLKPMKIGDLIIPTGAAYIGGTLDQYLKGERISPVPDFSMTLNLIDYANSSNVKCYKGPVFSSDAFYAEDPDFVSRWAEKGYIAVEMECATLFGLGMLRGIKTASALLVSDNLAEMQPMVDAQVLKEYVDRVSKVAFDALAKTDV